MKNWKYIIVSILTIAAVGYAARQGLGSVSKVNDPKPQHFVSGTFTGSEAKDPLSTTKNKQSYHLCGTLEYDFPSMTGTHAVCHESYALTITGCGFNDRLSLGIDQVVNGALAQYTPEVTAANTVKVVGCTNGITDGGSYNLADAGFTICCDGY